MTQHELDQRIARLRAEMSAVLAKMGRLAREIRQLAATRAAVQSARAEHVNPG